MLDLGEQPLANAFRQPGDRSPERRFPLVLCRCSACGHVQLSVTVNPELLFSRYLYMTGTSDSIPAHALAYAADVQRRFTMPGSLIVEIGSNDGTLLRAFEREAVRVLGVEPASNIAAFAESRGIPTLNRFFDVAAARVVRNAHGPADVILANNVVAHIHDLHGLASAIASLLAPAGVFIAEFPYLVDLLDGLEYDTIYHEHLSYFSVLAADRLFRQHGLTLFDVRRVAVHGGSIRIFVGRARTRNDEVAHLIDLERRTLSGSGKALREFARRVPVHREELTRLIATLRGRGERIAAYGAAAKANTMLNYCAFSADEIEFICDRSDLKRGLLTPGAHIPVRSPDTLLRERPTHTLLLAWNFKEEILRQQQPYRDAGGRFILPLPSPRIV